jgi:hypothetical protein
MPTKRMPPLGATSEPAVLEHVQLPLPFEPANSLLSRIVRPAGGYRCIHEVPPEVPVPTRGQKCPWLRVGRTRYFHLIKIGVLLKCTVKGIKRGKGFVFGCSVCQAKWGCTCGYYQVLQESRKRGGLT